MKRTCGSVEGIHQFTLLASIYIYIISTARCTCTINLSLQKCMCEAPEMVNGLIRLHESCSSGY